ncbi:DUF2567 domain-containing protein [Micromonospora sp. DT47]|uniref:DUF2567 domain-containing protein n=1 Tax=Micromonospora sp. DT47 TaxID=3393431 RepID=UPI003CECEFA1
MSPDTPDPYRPVARPDEPARAAGGPDGPAPASVEADTGGTPPADGPTRTTAAPGPGWGSLAGVPWPPAYAGSPAVREDRHRHTPAVTAATVLALTVLGVPLGLLWAAVAPDTPVLKTAEGAIYAQPQPEQPIAADGWFSLLGLGFGALVAVGLWAVLRRRRGPGGLFAVALGALGAALVAWQVGRRIGLSAYQRLLETAPDGTPFSKPADLRAGGIEWVLGVLPVPFGDLLLPAFAAAVTYTLLAGWSRWPSLRPEPEPDAVGVPWGPGGVSWVPGATPAPTAAPEPPAPGAAEPPRG